MALFQNPFIGMSKAQIDSKIERYEHLLKFDCNGLRLTPKGPVPHKNGTTWAHMKPVWERGLQLAKEALVS